MSVKVIMAVAILAGATLTQSKQQEKKECSVHETYSNILRRCIKCIEGCHSCTETSFNCTKCKEGYRFDKFTNGLCVENEQHDRLEKNLNTFNEIIQKLREFFYGLFIFLKIVVYGSIALILGFLALYGLGYYWMKKRGLDINEMEMSQVVSVVGEHYGWIKSSENEASLEEDHPLGEETERSMELGTQIEITDATEVKLDKMEK